MGTTLRVIQKFSLKFLFLRELILTFDDLPVGQLFQDLWLIPRVLILKAHVGLLTLRQPLMRIVANVGPIIVVKVRLLLNSIGLVIESLQPDEVTARLLVLPVELFFVKIGVSLLLWFVVTNAEILGILLE